jgi:hypothetical protein
LIALAMSDRSASGMLTPRGMIATVVIPQPRAFS